MIWPFLFVAAGVATALVTGLVRKYAVRRAMIDHPLERSSHCVPTPRGGGLAIALLLLASLLGAWYFRALDANVLAAIGGGAAIVAWIGWLDDTRKVSAAFRALIQVVAAIWTVAWLGGFPALRLGTFTLELGAFGSILAVIGVVWSTNLYNFMDGIDGIAAVQGFSAGLFGGVLLVLAGHPGLAALALTLSGSCLGFLYWNRTPARIFMGDVGSGLLGYAFAGIAIVSENQGAVPMLLWAVLAFVFVFDATVTLVLRLRHGHSWKTAHREHAYQRATLAGFTHMQVTGGVLVINMLLGLVAIWMWRTSTTLLEGTLVALTICAVCYKFVGYLAKPAGIARPRDASRTHPV